MQQKMPLSMKISLGFLIFFIVVLCVSALYLFG